MAKLNSRDEARRATREVEASSRADYSEALERGLLVLTAFEEGEERLTQAQLARKLGLPRATVRRALLTLAHLGYVVAEDRAYRLAPKVLTLASGYLTTNPVSRVLQPVCDALAEDFQASCTAAVLDGPVAVMIARALPRQSLAIGQGIGFQVPAARSALGRVLLAGVEGERRRRHLLGDEMLDEESMIQLEDTLSQVATQGYAYVAHEVEAGFHSVAVPLRRWDDTLIAALNVGASVERLSRDEMLDRVLPALQATARKLQPQLV
ncbi:IclR family transcriptional regulator domain-containing protein [Amycolatopsis thermophila]|uniref:IclR family pca regulon transcriptional regulator n=1 Tax=Amycolatopsis thermophila TaxID=206084 RepID=A0ABU0F1W7_9PSEU|nr:IclR family transcriptional regulator C-terminal domain-containing protein [Amycolatopsis thermophila]MDQ0381575.1 IclR family pca regulon transcriptional regulator [Amycolatopsis thermophila]